MAITVYRKNVFLVFSLNLTRTPAVLSAIVAVPSKLVEKVFSQLLLGVFFNGHRSMYWKCFFVYCIISIDPKSSYSAARGIINVSDYK